MDAEFEEGANRHGSVCPRHEIRLGLDVTDQRRGCEGSDRAELLMQQHDGRIKSHRLSCHQWYMALLCRSHHCPRVAAIERQRLFNEDGFPRLDGGQTNGM